MKDILAKLSDDELKDLKTKLTNQADSMPKLYKLIHEEVLRRSLKGNKDGNPQIILLTIVLIGYVSLLIHTVNLTNSKDMYKYLYNKERVNATSCYNLMLDLDKVSYDRCDLNPTDKACPCFKYRK